MTLISFTVLTLLTLSQAPVAGAPTRPLSYLPPLGDWMRLWPFRRSVYSMLPGLLPLGGSLVEEPLVAPRPPQLLSLLSL